MNVLQGRVQLLENVRIGLVTSRFNSEITEKLEDGALRRLVELGFADDQIIRIRVPGALEIPWAAQLLLREGCDGVVALGAVIRGETPHFDYVCAGVERGCSHLQLKFKKPVGFGVLTVDTDEQALARSGGKMGNKGVEAAEVVVELIDLMNVVKSNRTTKRKKGDGDV